MSDDESIQYILERGALTTFLQPIVHARKHCVWGFEALTRGPLLSSLRTPENLIQQAAALGLQLEFECLCIKTALRNFSKLSVNGRLFINASYQTLEQYQLLESSILSAVYQYAINPRRIVLELTEYSPIHNINALKRAVTKLHRIGFSVALDDLGAGHSSLQLWSQLDPDYVKLDRHFIHNIESDPIKQRFVRSLVDLARNQGCRIIAEGVQTCEEAQWLAEVQVRLMQGYYFARPRIHPMPIDPDRFPTYYANHAVESNNVRRLAR